MDEKKLQAFIQWLPTKFEEFQNKTPDEIAQSLNDLYNKGEEGQAALQGLWQTFEQEGEAPGMFKQGGKLDFLIQKMSKGGKSMRKCSCGCDLVMKKAKGGIIEECACGCKTKKHVKSHQVGGEIKNKPVSSIGATSTLSGAPAPLGGKALPTGAMGPIGTTSVTKTQSSPAGDVQKSLTTIKETNPHRQVNIGHMMQDSLIMRGHNPGMVAKTFAPFMLNANNTLDARSRQGIVGDAPEVPNQREQGLMDFIQQFKGRR